MSDMGEFEDNTVASDEQIKVISNLIKLQVVHECKVASAEATLKEAKKQLRKVAEIDLPDAMTAAGMALFKTDNGLLVEISEKMTASISAKNKPAAIQWLMEHDLESLIKENVVVPFDKGEAEKVKNFVEMLEANGVSDFSVAPTINTASVKSSLKELIEEGVDVPNDTFGLFFFKQAIIKESP